MEYVKYMRVFFFNDWKTNSVNEFCLHIDVISLLIKFTLRINECTLNRVVWIFYIRSTKHFLIRINFSIPNYA